MSEVDELKSWLKAEGRNYSLENPILEKEIDGKKIPIPYTIVRNKKGKMVLDLPTEHCSPSWVKEKINQIELAKPTT